MVKTCGKEVEILFVKIYFIKMRKLAADVWFTTKTYSYTPRSAVICEGRLT